MARFIECFQMRTFYYLGLALLLLWQQSSGEETLCYKCDNVFQPALCMQTTLCAADEACYVERGLDNIGATKFYSGCLAQTECPTEHGDHFPIEQCLRCCLGDLCNIKGCGSLALMEENQLACFTCNDVTDSKDCHVTSVCSRDQVCGSRIKTVGAGVVYDLGCFDSSACADPNTKCCDSNGCNFNETLTLPALVTTKSPVTTTTRDTSLSLSSTYVTSKPSTTTNRLDTTTAGITPTLKLTTKLDTTQISRDTTTATGIPTVRDTTAVVQDTTTVRDTTTFVTMPSVRPVTTTQSVRDTTTSMKIATVRDTTTPILKDTTTGLVRDTTTPMKLATLQDTTVPTLKDTTTVPVPGTTTPIKIATVQDTTTQAVKDTTTIQDTTTQKPTSALPTTKGTTKLLTTLQLTTKVFTTMRDTTKFVTTTGPAQPTTRGTTKILTTLKPTTKDFTTMRDTTKFVATTAPAQPTTRGATMILTTLQPTITTMRDTTKFVGVTTTAPTPTTTRGTTKLLTTLRPIITTMQDTTKLVATTAPAQPTKLSPSLQPTSNVITTLQDTVKPIPTTATQIDTTKILPTTATQRDTARMTDSTAASVPVSQSLLTTPDISTQGNTIGGMTINSTQIPSQSIAPAIIGVNETTVTMRTGADLVFLCNATGLQPIAFNWTKPAEGQGIERMNGIILSLTDIQPQHSGDYVCEATNVIGTATKTFHVEVKDPLTN